jgi:hypothetical protein
VDLRSMPLFNIGPDGNVIIKHKAGDVVDLPGSFLNGLVLQEGGAEALNKQVVAVKPRTEIISSEKLNILLWFLEQRLEADPNFHVVAWSVYRLELQRILAAVAEKFPQFEVGSMIGDQTAADRQRALKLLHPDTSPRDRPVFVGGIYGTGSYGLNFTAAHTSINCSFDYSLGRHLQAKDRVYGPGQTEPIAYYDIIATGPSGQKTIDHVIVAARKKNEDIADYTTTTWVKALMEE